MKTKNNTCTKCGGPGIPGLLRGAGKCRHHWNEGAYGSEWANGLLCQDYDKKLAAWFSGRLGARRDVRRALET